MNITNELATKPRSTRYTNGQMDYFAELEKLGINVSHYVRQAVDEKRAREKQKPTMLSYINQPTVFFEKDFIKKSN